MMHINIVKPPSVRLLASLAQSACVDEASPTEDEQCLPTMQFRRLYVKDAVLGPRNEDVSVDMESVALHRVLSPQ